jgi:orotidine-5'-phosphate decarboxylase
MKRKNIPLKDRIIFALDVATVSEAEEWVEKLGDHIHFFKVGFQLFLAGWWPVIDMITGRGHKVMCDLKLFDVPATVRLALQQIKQRGVTFTTVHGNGSILEAAVKEKNGLQILAVTVLTSFGEDDIQEMGFRGKIEDLVFTRAKKAIEFGCDGIVASGLEAQRLRSKLGDDFFIVTPGIRPGKDVGKSRDDQVRIITAQDAVTNGADYVVVGRPISTAKDPIAVVESMQEEIEKGLGMT